MKAIHKTDFIKREIGFYESCALKSMDIKIFIDAFK